jgi:hypothetical protein
MTRGILLVANKNSQNLCKNLIFSIRESGCLLPIRIIHFGGRHISCTYIKNQADIIYYKDFSEQAKLFINNIKSVLTDCPTGFLYRYLGFFSDWDEFIYSDNDIVALCNWNILFDHLHSHDLIHADEEYTTSGIYNYYQPEHVCKIFGDSALESAITAGHIVVRRSEKMITDINNAIEWFRENPDIPKKHDQSLLHIASLLGKWELLNLCKPPYNWLSSWAGDYANSLQLVQKIQTNCSKISHIHYSGSTPKGNMAIQDLLYASDTDSRRLSKLVLVWFKSFLKFRSLTNKLRKAKYIYQR